MKSLQNTLGKLAIISGTLLGASGCTDEKAEEGTNIPITSVEPFYLENTEYVRRMEHLIYEEQTETRADIFRVMREYKERTSPKIRTDFHNLTEKSVKEALSLREIGNALGLPSADRVDGPYVNIVDNTCVIKCMYHFSYEEVKDGGLFGDDVAVKKTIDSHARFVFSAEGELVSGKVEHNPPEIYVQAFKNSGLLEQLTKQLTITDEEYEDAGSVVRQWVLEHTEARVVEPSLEKEIDLTEAMAAFEYVGMPFIQKMGLILGIEDYEGITGSVYEKINDNGDLELYWGYHFNLKTWRMIEITATISKTGLVDIHAIQSENGMPDEPFALDPEAVKGAKQVLSWLVGKDINLVEEEDK